MNIIKKMYHEFCSEENEFGAKPYWMLCTIIVSILFIDVLPAYLLFDTMHEFVSVIVYQKEFYLLDHDSIITFPCFAMIIIFFNYMVYMVFIKMFFGSVYFYKLALRPLYKYPFKLACLRTGVPIDVALPASPEIINGKYIQLYLSQPPPETPLYKCINLGGIYFISFIFIYIMIPISSSLIPDKVNFNFTKYVIPKITNYKFCYAYAEKNYPDKINFKMAFAKDYDKCLLPDTKFQSQTFYSADNIKDFKKDSSNIFWTILKFSIAPLLILFLAFGKIFSKKK